MTHLLIDATDPRVVARMTQEELEELLLEDAREIPAEWILHAAPAELVKKIEELRDDDDL